MQINEEESLELLYEGLGLLLEKEENKLLPDYSQEQSVIYELKGGKIKKLRIGIKEEIEEYLIKKDKKIKNLNEQIRKDDYEEQKRQ